MKGSRNRKVWVCRDSKCKGKKLHSWRAWSSHLWDKHHIALLRKFKYGVHKEDANNDCRRGRAA